MDAETATALAELRQFNYDRIYMRPESVAQAEAVIAILRALVDHLIAHPNLVPGTYDGDPPPEGLEEIDEPVWRGVAYVAGMTDRFAFEQAEALLNYDLRRIPAGIGRGI